MARSRLFRFRDRASYKASEVLGLFIISMFLGMIFFLFCVLVDQFVQRVMHWA
jgi:hypothetical protein